MTLPAVPRVPSAPIATTVADKSVARGAFAARLTHQLHTACRHRACTPGCSVILLKDMNFESFTSQTSLSCAPADVELEGAMLDSQHEH
ncbi:hypothetical protein EVAR_89895_1 [Eumeta japonica]|uniref:Uncharacterized protein n=1 Tax=Eumeta variegata TaxID=151549 RepID=A0A4C1YY42_EUMVA|nr:hypothetical protein EVAR_89895_1 [Eumeta japonica]